MLQKLLAKQRKFNVKNLKQYMILHFNSCIWWLERENRRNGVVVIASALRSVGSASFPKSSIPKYFWKMVFTDWQLSCLALSIKGIVWRTCRKAYLVCLWARHLMGCLHFYVADRRLIQVVYPSWWPSVNKDKQNGLTKAHNLRSFSKHKKSCPYEEEKPGDFRIGCLY